MSWVLHCQCCDFFNHCATVPASVCEIEDDLGGIAKLMSLGKQQDRKLDPPAVPLLSSLDFAGYLLNGQHGSFASVFELHRFHMLPDRGRKQSDAQRAK